MSKVAAYEKGAIIMHCILPNILLLYLKADQPYFICNLHKCSIIDLNKLEVKDAFKSFHRYSSMCSDVTVHLNDCI